MEAFASFGDDNAMLFNLDLDNYQLNNPLAQLIYGADTLDALTAFVLKFGGRGRFPSRAQCAPKLLLRPCLKTI